MCDLEKLIVTKELIVLQESKTQKESCF